MAGTLPQQIEIEIVTPSRQLFSGSVDEVSVPGIHGYMGILPGHAPLLSELKSGVISYRVSGREHRLFCGWGFVEVLPEQVSILAEEAERPDQIDVEKARREKEEAEKLLGSKSPETDFEDALRRYEAAAARLQVVGE